MKCGVFMDNNINQNGIVSTKSFIWNSIMKCGKEIIEKFPELNIVLYSDSESLFYENFDYYESIMKNNFMKKPKEKLDRHKISAIIICAFLHNDIFGISAKQESRYKNGNIFLGNEVIALDTALSYMYKQLQDDIKDGKVEYEKIFPKYEYPEPQSCDRKFDLVLCRELYYSKKFFVLNPLSLANLLFFIEEYSFKVHDIKKKSERATASST